MQRAVVDDRSGAVYNDGVLLIVRMMGYRRPLSTLILPRKDGRILPIHPNTAVVGRRTAAQLAKNPRVAWYDLPALYRSRRDEFLSANGSYSFSGYGEMLRRYLLRMKSPVPHPFLRRD